MPIKIALAGNPNSGKTTMFNSLTGSNQYVGNWPGVTVEKKEGRLKGHNDIIVTDLPGIYSLSPYTLEEVVTRNYLLDEKPDVILDIVDASNIERNLYLTTQLAELGIPVVIALNMMDVVQKRGDSIDIDKLSGLLGCQIVETAAVKDDGTLAAAEVAIAKAGTPTSISHSFARSTENSLKEIEGLIAGRVPAHTLRWYAIKVFERDSKVLAALDLPKPLLSRISEIIAKREAEEDDDSESIITNERYAYITSVVSNCVQRDHVAMTASDKIDRIVTSRVLAIPIFAVIMFLVYFISVTTVGALVTDFTNDTLFGEWISAPLAAWLSNIGTADWLVGLLVDGIIGGVGAVLGFVPQMLILFFLLCILEDCGYMSRVAFIMDRVFHRFGLSGKSFIPLLIGSGCSVPGIMATRTIEQERDRRMTIMTTSFIPCGAKMPIVALIAGAMFGGAAWVAPSAYFVGIAAVVLSGLVLKKTKMFAGDPAPFVLELPPYHVPTIKNVLRGTWDKGWSFIKKAGTVILLASILVWFTSNFGFARGSFSMVEDMDASMLAAAGNAIAPVFKPLGFGNWQSAVATILGLLAKEQVVGTFGVLYGAESAAGQTAAFAMNFTALSAYTFLIFNLLCAPCVAAMSAIKREMNSGKWTAFTLGYQTVFAYGIALMLYQFGLLFTGGGFTVGTLAGILALCALIYLLARKPSKPKADSRLKDPELAKF